MKLWVFLRGGLGNQLFQYSTGVHLSQSFGLELEIRADLLPSQPDQIGGISRWPAQISEFEHFGTLTYRSQQPPMGTNLFSKVFQLMRSFGDVAPNVTAMLGWHANETNARIFPRLPDRVRLINSYAAIKDYAQLNRNILRHQTSTLVSPSRTFLRLRETIEALQPTVLHIRLGDYIGLEHIYGPMRIERFEAGIGRLRPREREQPVWIFTDSPDFIDSKIKKRLGVSRVVAPSCGMSPLENLLLMGKGGALVASNSSFSWWAAFLAKDGHPVVAPCFDSAKANNFDRKDSSRFGWTIQET